jgi:phosphoglycerol transferase MdoB-like AlkP superfamily enzyme
MGFSRSIFEETFPGKDKDWIWISNDEHVMVNKETITPLLQNDVPVLNYMLTSSGHINYQLNTTKRPRVITTTLGNQITNMVNNIYYNSRSIGSYVRYLLAHDPQSIIIVIGDHQGSLQRFDPTRQHQKTSNEANALSRKLRVPYLFLDAGQKMEFGLISHYEIPHMILARLKGEEYHPVTRNYGFDIIRSFRYRTIYSTGGFFGLCPNANDVNCLDIAVFQDESISRLVGMIEESRTMN